MKIRKIFRYDQSCKRLRLFRFIWANGKKCIAVGLEPYIYKRDNEYFNNAITILFIRINLKNRGGGKFV